MSFSWIYEDPPYWDDAKAKIVGAAPPGAFDLKPQQEGDLLAGDWWRVEEDGVVLGYGWMDCTWGDAEILLTVGPEQQKRGVGTFILDKLEEEAAVRGLNYLFNVVLPSHPDRSGITKWLQKRRFERSQEDLLRRHVRHPKKESS